MTRNVKNKIKCFLIGILILLIVIAYWVLMLSFTQQATDDNTYQCQVKINSVSLHYATHRGTNKINIHTDENDYILNTGIRDAGKTKELTEALFLPDEPKKFEITVLKGMPRPYFVLFDGVWFGKQIVGIQNDTDIYWHIEDYNSFQKAERISGMIAGFFISVIAVGLEAFICWWVVKT